MSRNKKNGKVITAKLDPEVKTMTVEETSKSAEQAIQKVVENTIVNSKTPSQIVSGEIDKVKTEGFKIPEDMYTQIADDLNKGVTKSSWIRKLLALGTKKSIICKALDVQYPMVIGVEKRAKEQGNKPQKEIKVIPETVLTAAKVTLENGASKSEVIRSLLREGFERAVISRSLGIPYPMVMGVETRMNQTKIVDLDKVKETLTNCTPDQLVEISIRISELISIKVLDAKADAVLTAEGIPPLTEEEVKKLEDEMEHEIPTEDNMPNGR